MAGKKSAKQDTFTINCDFDRMEQVALKLKNFCEPLEAHVLHDLATDLPTVGTEIEANGTLARDTKMGDKLREAAQGIEQQRQALYGIQANIQSIVSAGRNTETVVKKLVMSQASGENS